MLGPEQREGGMGTEAWFRGLLTNISDTVSLFGTDGRLIFTTGADNEVLGHPRSFWRSGDPLEIVHPDDRRILEEGWSYAVEHPGEEVAGEVRMRTASGNWEHVAVTGLSLFDDPDVGAMVVTSRNVTPLRRAERLASHQAAVLERQVAVHPQIIVAGVWVGVWMEQEVVNPFKLLSVDFRPGCEFEHPVERNRRIVGPLFFTHESGPHGVMQARQRMRHV